MAEEKRKKKKRLRNLDVFSIHFVDEPAVERAKFLVKKRKGGFEMDEKEVLEERQEEEKVSKELEEKANEAEIAKAEDPMEIVKAFLEQIKGLETKLPAPVELAIEELRKAVEEGYGYPAPEEKSKNPELAKLYEELEKSKRETQELKAQLWAKEHIAKGKPPAVVNKLAEKLIEAPEMKELFDEILKSVPSVELGQKTEEAIKKSAEDIQERVNKLAKALNWVE